jgi:hypothetical protein
MFFSYLDQHSKILVNNYFENLKVMAALTLLSSSNATVPFIGYREVENIFCESFNAHNVSRDDISVDAHINNTGIGLKTFLASSPNQKIAEFNKLAKEYRNLDKDNLVRYIAKERNNRLSTTSSKLELNNLIYHCVTRLNNKLVIFEEPMELINLDALSEIKISDTTVFFTDNKHYYSFHRSKSTLFKRFNTPTKAYEVEVSILKDPLRMIREFMQRYNYETPGQLNTSELSSSDYILLPLYAPRSHKDNRYVAPKSGLNQWAAQGRPRDINEVYIPIPLWIHKEFPDFFPGKEPFALKLPTGETISAKVCQEGGKALMSNPNSILGRWLLRDVLKVAEGDIITYQTLAEKGIDSIKIEKTAESYKIDFMRIGAYERFEINHKQ